MTPSWLFYCITSHLCEQLKLLSLRHVTILRILTSHQLEGLAAEHKMSDQLLQVIAPDLSLGVLAFLDVDSLVTMELVSAATRSLLRVVVEARCKRECFSTYLYPTMATYTTMSAAPLVREGAECTRKMGLLTSWNCALQSWKHLYLRFRWLREMQWTACKAEGTSSSLRSLKTDNQEYVADIDGQFLLRSVSISTVDFYAVVDGYLMVRHGRYRSGGHYWFSVLQTPLSDVVISNPNVSLGEELQQAINLSNGTDNNKPLAFLRAPLSINAVKWEKLRADGPAPCPRRHHSMTCLKSVTAPLSTLNPPAAEDASAMVTIRRVLFFGGQSEGIPFDAFNDMHVLLVEGRSKPSRWVRHPGSAQRKLPF
jgi:hypothetical protein